MPVCCFINFLTLSIFMSLFQSLVSWGNPFARAKPWEKYFPRKPGSKSEIGSCFFKPFCTSTSPYNELKNYQNYYSVYYDFF